MSRARYRTDIHTTADDVTQAVEQLADDWATDRRQRWILDRSTREQPAFEREPHRPPTVAERLDALTRRRGPPDRGIDLGR